MEEYIFADGVFVGKDILTIYEGLYLLESRKIKVYDKYGKELDITDILTEDLKKRYIVYKFLKERNIIFGAGMKFGGTFRVYENPGDDHSKWICFPVYKNEKFTIYEFLAKNRVAHSTRKTLLISIVDKDKIRKFLEIKWKKL
ncbi:MAG TPA: tRNA-intron lyase [Candidatus Nanopusillus sp.]|nr:tRNA-intron lyase [Candidatus Nanopusillus sp.]